MLQGFDFTRSLHGKPFTFDLRGSLGYGCEAHWGLIGAIAGVVWATLGLVGVAPGVVETTLGSVGVAVGGAEAAWGSVDVVAGVVEAVWAPRCPLGLAA